MMYIHMASLNLNLKNAFASFASNHHDHHQNTKGICFYMNTNKLKVTTLSTLQLASTNLLAMTTCLMCSYKEEEKEKKQTNNNRNKKKNKKSTVSTIKRNNQRIKEKSCKQSRPKTDHILISQTVTRGITH